MIHPDSRPEVADVIREISEELTAAQLLHVCEADPENPDIYTVAAHDDDGFVNTGLCGWSETQGTVFYACHNPVTEAHDKAEGVPDDESKCWWSAQSTEVFVWHLSGRVRKMAAKWQRVMQESMDESGTEST